MDKSCFTCRWWAITPDPSVGECRGCGVIEREGGFRRFPMTLAIEWCCMYAQETVPLVNPPASDSPT